MCMCVCVYVQVSCVHVHTSMHVYKQGLDIRVEHIVQDANKPNQSTRISIQCPSFDSSVALMRVSVTVVQLCVLLLLYQPTC